MFWDERDLRASGVWIRLLKDAIGSFDAIGVDEGGRNDIKRRPSIASSSRRFVDIDGFVRRRRLRESSVVVARLSGIHRRGAEGSELLRRLGQIGRAREARSRTLHGVEIVGAEPFGCLFGRFLFCVCGFDFFVDP